MPGKKMQKEYINNILRIAQGKRDDDPTAFGWYGKVVARIETKTVREVERKDGSKAEVHSLKLDDGTGNIWLSVWDPSTNFKEGETVEARGVYTKYDDYRSEFKLALAKNNSSIKVVSAVDVAADAAAAKPDAAKAKPETPAVDSDALLKKILQEVVEQSGMYEKLKKHVTEVGELLMTQLKVLIDGPQED